MDERDVIVVVNVLKIQLPVIGTAELREHRFVYDEEELRRTLGEIGFRVVRVDWNESKHPELCYLDLRDFGLNLFIEATRS